MAQTKGTESSWVSELQLGKYFVIRKVADSVALELNNVLASVIGLASVIETEVDPESSVYQDVQGILSASRRGIRLTRNLMGFSRNGDATYRERIHLNDALGKVVSMLQRSIPLGVAVETDLADDLDDIEGDPSQIRHVLVNLTANAVDAIQSDGVLTITTKNIEIAAGAEEQSASLAAGRYVRLQVADTGTGMDQETLSQAFEPFFSTKPPGTATGLGLPLVHHIVTSHGGKIDLFSKPRLGTTVTIHLPSHGPRRRRPPTGDTPREQLRERSGTILLVDDDPLVLRAARRILQRLGYSVVTAEGGEEAITRFEERRGEVTCAIVDLIMPGIDGVELLRRLKELAPDLPVIVASGYAKDQPVQEVLEGGAVAFVRKPFTLRELAASLDGVMEEGR